MPDTKITALAAITTVAPSADLFPIVDVSDNSMAASGTTKNITVNQLLGAGGTATLASATITGDLTVDTSTLKVDSANNRVGIGTATPGAYALDVKSTTAAAQLRIFGSNQNSITFGNAAGGASNGFLMGRSFSSDDANNLFVYDLANSALRFFIGNTGNVGIATPAPSYRLSVNASNPTSGNIAQFYNDATSSLNGAFCLITQFGVQDWYMGQPAGVSAFTIGTGTTSKSEFFRIDGSGNVGIGVTPSASKLQVAGNIGLPNTCTASGETSGVFSIDVANLLTLTGGNWRQASILLVYSGVNTDLSNPTVLQTVVTLTGLSTWNTIAKNDIVGTASVAVSNDTTTGARITVTVPAGNSGTVYAVLLGGAGGTTRPSMTINA